MLKSAELLDRNSEVAAFSVALSATSVLKIYLSKTILSLKILQPPARYVPNPSSESLSVSSILP